MRRPIGIIVTGLVLALGSGIEPSHARVFFQTGGSGTVDALADLLDGDVVYSAEVQMNDSQGDVYILSLSTSYLEAARRLTHGGVNPAGGRMLFFPGPTMSNGLLYNDRTVTRLLLVDLVGRDRSLLFAFRQTAADYERSLGPPKNHRLAEIAGYPGSTPLTFWQNSNTRLAVATAQTRDEPQRIIRYYSDMLATDGWNRVPGNPARLENMPGAVFFAKGQQFCAIAAKESDAGETIITILHKQFGTE